jgi:transcriptional regulator with XRE-family HTH domain
MTEKEFESLKQKFGKNLQKIRESKKLSLLNVSYNCPIDDSKISKIEHGRIHITLSTIVELAKGLDVHPKKLLDFDFECIKSLLQLHFNIDLLFIQPVTHRPHKGNYR